MHRIETGLDYYLSNMNMQHADLAVSANWVIPIVPESTILKNCSVIVSGETIIDICPSDDIASRYSVKEHVKLENHVLMPGLVNAHAHSAMALLRGYADDLKLEDWLNNHIWPAESQLLSESFVHTGSQLAIAEMLLSGTTCFADNYFFAEATAKAAFDTGIRAQLDFPILNFPTSWASSVDESFEKGIALHDAYRAHHLINIGFGPHAPYTVDDATLVRVATYAEEMQAHVQMHVHETAYEVENAINTRGMRPLERLNNLGLLSPLVQCVHMTQITHDDIAILQQTGANVVHCPQSNLKLASGFCPVNDLQQANINVALGTDSAASNNSLSMFSELKFAALLAKGVSEDAQALPAHKALQMATLNGAKAIGMEKCIGSLETGKFADMISIDLSQLSQQPIFNPASQLVYTDVSNQVQNVWVAGKQLVKARELQTLDTQALRKHTAEWQEKIKTL